MRLRKTCPMKWGSARTVRAGSMSVSSVRGNGFQKQNLSVHYDHRHPIPGLERLKTVPEARACVPIGPDIGARALAPPENAFVAEFPHRVTKRSDTDSKFARELAFRRQLRPGKPLACLQTLQDLPFRCFVKRYAVTHLPSSPFARSIRISSGLPLQKIYMTSVLPVILNSRRHNTD